MENNYVGFIPGTLEQKMHTYNINIYKYVLKDKYRLYKNRKGVKRIKILK